MDKKWQGILLVAGFAFVALSANYMSGLYGLYAEPDICYLNVGDNVAYMSIRIMNITVGDHLYPECVYLKRACEQSLFNRIYPDACTWYEIGDDKFCECNLIMLPTEDSAEFT